MAQTNNAASFDAEKDIPSLTGRVILVTGGNVGLGKQSCLDFARHDPAQIWLAARNLDKAKAAADDIKKAVPGAPIIFLQLDLNSLESVKRAAKTFAAESDRLDILMLNAGVMAQPPGLTEDGYEIHLGTNYLGHALLTKLLLPILKKTAQNAPKADVRVIALSSGSHRWAPTEGIRFDSLKTTGKDMAAFALYGQSKLANILFARQFAKLYPQFTVSAIHPGLVATTLWDRATGAPTIMKWIAKFARGYVPGAFNTVEQGVKNQLWASVGKGVESGEYYAPVGVGGTVKPKGKDDQLAKELWEWTETELKEHVP